ncbi:solute carrier family 35 member B1 homolog [Scaptodrosophila lebanonensis]|uniref:Solute carrier family 35 member B1 homolog n=1 Tax=Drosophila lebanonensis TaxID=7225 RepID=A0A6J2TUL7_DROLE|nr:solute carrier family 35 member B1 homolog [Scaptodrosophila lebanonensis]
MNMPENSRFVIYAAGIFFCYFVYGIVQEDITRGRYGDQVQPDGSIGEKYTHALALVWIQCFCNSLFAKGMLMGKPQKEDTTHTGSYAASALSYLIGMVSSNMALRWVPYPTQVVGKSAKPIPIMILVVLIGHKTYSWTRYACVLTLVVGIILFMYKESKVSDLPTETMGLGALLIFLSLSMDGLCGAFQERMRAASAPSGQHMMLAMNFWSTLMLGGAMILTGEGKEFLHFATRHPQLWAHIALIALCGAMGQLFVFLMVAGFGTLACSMVTTTRKFFTVLWSVLIFGNRVVLRQWFGVVLVFAALFADILVLYGKKQVPSQNSPSDAILEGKKEALQPPVAIHSPINIP